MKITGILKQIGDTITVGQSNFTKREIVVSTVEQYPQHILIELQGDRTTLVDSFAIGEPVNVSINIKGREWTSPDNQIKYFNTIVGWNIEKLK